MQRFRKLLYVEERVTGACRGFAYALDVARLSGAELTVAAAPSRSSRGPFPAAAGAAEVRGASQARWLARLAELARAGDRAGVAVSTTLLDGDLVTRVIEEVDRGGHDLVLKVAGSRSPWWSLRPVSPDRRLVRRCRASVWVVDPAQRVGLGGRAGLRAGDAVVLAAVGLGTEPEAVAMDDAVVTAAGSLASLSGATLVVLHAWSLLGEEALLGWGALGSRRSGLRGRRSEERAARASRLRALVARGAPDGAAEVILRRGDVARAVLSEAWRLQADVVVVGSDGRRGPGGLLRGEVAERIAARLPASLLVVKPGATAPPVATRAAASGSWEGGSRPAPPVPEAELR